MSPRRSPLNPALLTVAALLLATTGCSEESTPPGPGPSGEAGSSAPAAVPEEKGSAAPITLDVTADKTHAVQPGDEIRIELSLEGFVLDDTKIGAEAGPGAGHYHVYLGDPGGKPLLVSADASAVVKVPDDVNDGTHALRVQLRNHDHSPLDPPVEAVVRLIIYRL